jgi:hypothetical protein
LIFYRRQIKNATPRWRFLFSDTTQVMGIIYLTSQLFQSIFRQTSQVSIYEMLQSSERCD